MIDIHCHILPGIDDGPETKQESLDLARACVADGITHVVATPHVFPGRYNNCRTGIAQSCMKFRQILVAEDIPLGLSFAGEVRLSHEVMEMLQKREIPFLGELDGWKTMLLELPDAQIPLGAINLVRHLTGAGIRPILVHPERNKAIMDKPERVEAFVGEGCYLQITAASLVGQFGSRVGAAACYMLENGWVNAVASDAHNISGRPPRMKKAREFLEKQFGQEVAEELTHFSPSRLCGFDGEKFATVA